MNDGHPPERYVFVAAPTRPFANGAVALRDAARVTALGCPCYAAAPFIVVTDRVPCRFYE